MIAWVSTEILSLHHTEDSHWLSILHMVMHRFQCYCLNLSHPLLPSKWDFYLTWRWHTLQLPSIQHMYNRRNISPFHWKKPWCWERLRAGGEGDDWGRDGWMVSTTQQTWVWASSGRWWRTGEPRMLQFMGSQRVGHNWATEQQQSSKANWKSSSLKNSGCSGERLSVDPYIFKARRNFGKRNLWSRHWSSQTDLELEPWPSNKPPLFLVLLMSRK